VRDIPFELLPVEEDKSYHASTMFENPIATEWFCENLVKPQEWELDHPNDVPPDKPNHFNDYINEIRSLGYKVWNIGNKQHATSYLKVISETDNNKFITIAGRADFLITKKDVTIAEYLHKVLCVIEIQSKTNQELCELQMQAYLSILMNTKHLLALAGFLIFNNGQCRAYKAFRDGMGDCLFEMNDLFHIAYLPNIMDDVLRELGLVV
jgi:hypothetical protein